MAANFFGNPSDFKEKVSHLSADDFKVFLAKKEEQWAFLQDNRASAYRLVGGDADDDYTLDAFCMKHLYEEKEKRGI